MKLKMLFKFILFVLVGFGCGMSAIGAVGYDSEGADDIGRRQIRELDINHRPSFMIGSYSVAKPEPNSVTTKAGSTNQFNNKNKVEQEPYPITAPSSQAPSVGKHLNDFRDGADKRQSGGWGGSNGNAGIFR